MKVEISARTEKLLSNPSKASLLMDYLLSAETRKRYRLVIRDDFVDIVPREIPAPVVVGQRKK